MFALIESGRRTGQHGAWSGRALSLAIHAGLITASVVATRHMAGVVEPPIIAVPMPWPTSPARDPEPCRRCRLPGVPAPLPIPVPARVPDPLASPVITPYVAPGPPADPGPVRLVPALPGPVLSGSAPFLSQDLDEPPVMLSHPEPRYPDVLRLAGIEGRVVIEAVLDTTGRAEPGSLRVVSASHPLFAAEAQAVVLGSRYRPGRMGARAVRVRVNVPVAFSIRR